MDTPELPHPASDIIPRLMDYVYNTSKCSNAKGGDQLQWRVTIGYRRFVALSYLMRPSAVAKDLPAWKVAEAIGISPARFSQICRELSAELGGLKHPRMESESARRAKSEAHKGLRTKVSGKRKVVRVVANQPSMRNRVEEGRGIASALKSFADGGAWTKNQSKLLRNAGIIDGDGMFTAEGIKAMSGSSDCPPPG